MLVFSFGTGEEINNMSPKKAYQAPTKLFWSSYVMGDVMDDANAVQNYVCSRELEAEEKAIEFRRFQIDLGMKAMKEVGVSLEELKPIVPFMKREPDFSRLKMDSIRHFGLFELIGRKFADYLSQKRLFRTKGVEVGQTLLKASEVLRYVSEVENGFTGIKD